MSSYLPSCKYLWQRELPLIWLSDLFLILTNPHTSGDGEISSPLTSWQVLYHTLITEFKTCTIHFPPHVMKYKQTCVRDGRKSQELHPVTTIVTSQCLNTLGCDKQTFLVRRVECAAAGLEVDMSKDSISGTLACKQVKNKANDHS